MKAFYPNCWKNNIFSAEQITDNLYVEGDYLYTIPENKGVTALDGALRHSPFSIKIRIV